MYYFSKTTNGFYISGINPTIPEDAVPVTDADYLALFSTPYQSKIIKPDANGYPVLVDND